MSNTPSSPSQSSPSAPPPASTSAGAETSERGQGETSGRGQSATESGRPSASLARSGHGGGAALRTEHGVTTIASSVVAKIAALATQEIPGVQAMGKTMSRAFGSIRSRIPGADSTASTQGVSVEVGERQAAVDIDIVVYYGQSIIETATAIRENVIERVEGMTGLEVVEVNVAVDDLYLESEGGDHQDSRVE